MHVWMSFNNKDVDGRDKLSAMAMIAIQSHRDQLARWRLIKSGSNSTPRPARLGSV